MIAQLKGIIDSIIDQEVVLDVQGVGYLVHCSQKTIDILPNPGTAVTLLIETVVREDALTLYGFQNSFEKECFKLLTSVQGVGMKVALAILSALAPSEVYQAIAHEDKALVSRADGVGPKLATRIINELKDKVARLTPIPASPYTRETIKVNDPKIEDAIAALSALGYKRFEIDAALASLEKDTLTTQELIRAGLGKLSGSLLKRS